MAKIENIAVPKGSLLAEFGPPGAYRDCFIREVPGSVKLEQFVERFYCSAAFRPERIVLGLIGKGASNADARAVARGEVESFAAWSVVERREAPRSGSGGEDGPQGQPVAQHRSEILLQDFRGTTASWLAVQPHGQSTKLLFGSWVGEPDRGIVKALMPFHRWYSRVLLRGVA